MEQTNYNWKEDDIFHLTGKEFELLINATRAKLATPEVQNALLLVEMNKVLEKLLVDGINKGIVKAMSSPPKELPAPKEEAPE